MLLRLTNLQRGTGSVELYLDCTQVDSVHNLPRAFSGLSQNPGSIELRTFQRKAQVGTTNHSPEWKDGMPRPREYKGICFGKCIVNSTLFPFSRSNAGCALESPEKLLRCHP